MQEAQLVLAGIAALGGLTIGGVMLFVALRAVIGRGY